VAEAGLATIASSSNPGAPTPAWALTGQLGGSNALASISCPGKSLCVIADDAHNLLTSTNPSPNSHAWSSARLATGDQLLDSVSCPFVSFCVTVGDRSAATSTNPAGGASAWPVQTLHQIFNYKGDPVGLGALSCASRSLCVTTVDNGVSVTGNPTGGAPAWRMLPFGEPDYDEFVDVSCPAANLCITTDLQSGRIAVSTRPLVLNAWKFRRLTGPNTTITGVSCVSRTFCVVVDATGEIFTSTNPAGSAKAWKRIRIAHENLGGVSCGSKSLCVAIDNQDRALVSTNPAAAHPRYRAAVIDRPLGALSAPDQLSAVACIPGGSCVVGDVNGNVIVGRLAR
jgi:hypothetical protein